MQSHPTGGSGQLCHYLQHRRTATIPTMCHNTHTLLSHYVQGIRMHCYWLSGLGVSIRKPTENKYLILTLLPGYIKCIYQNIYQIFTVLLLVLFDMWMGSRVSINQGLQWGMHNYIKWPTVIWLYNVFMSNLYEYIYWCGLGVVVPGMYACSLAVWRLLVIPKASLIGTEEKTKCLFTLEQCQ